MTKNRARKKAQRAAAVSYGKPFSRADPRSRLHIDAQPRIPCPDGCCSQYQLWDSGAGSMVVCAWCDEPVCVDCQRAPVADEFARCPECQHWAYEADQDAERRRQCVGQCITEAQAWEQQHPGQYWDGRDGATGDCLNCPNAICMECHAAPASHLFGACLRCDMQDVGCWLPWELQSVADLTDELQQLVAQIGRAGGGPNNHIMGWINRQMGVKRRADADEQRLGHGIQVARRWLTRLHRTNNSPDPQ